MNSHSTNKPALNTETNMELESSQRRLLLRGMAAAVPLFSTMLAGCGGANATTTPYDASNITITTDPYKVAIVGKEASANLNLAEGLVKLIALMQEAKNSGARLIVCGELWLPGYPIQLNFQSDWKQTNWANYVANSITIGDANWLRILDAARSIGIYLSLGFSEIDGNYAYMAQVLIADDGTLIYKRRKIRPSGGERDYWSDAPMAANLQAVTTPLGRITMLECWDHLRPQSTFNIMAQLPNVHICAWPYIPATTPTTQFWEREEVAHGAAAYFSQLTGAYTLLPGVGHVAVYKNSVKVAEMLASDSAAILYYAITPDNWAGTTGSTTSEFSYGILQLLSDNYPGSRVADTEHGTLKLNALT